MPTYRLKDQGGSVREVFENSADPEDEAAVMALLKSRARSRKLKDASLDVKHRGQWRTYRM